MGDRGNVVILPSFDNQDPATASVALYTHWGGTNLPTTVAEALNSLHGRARRTDASYLARIILDTMTGCEGGETGYGISAGGLVDNEHPVIVVDTTTRRVAIRKTEDWHELTQRVTDTEGQTMDEFCATATPFDEDDE